MPDPRLGRHERRSAQWQRRCGAQTIGQAAPRPVLGASNEPGGERVPFDRAADSKEAVWRGDHLHIQTFPVNRRAVQAWPGALQPDGMGICYPLDQARESHRARGAEHEMPVIVHDAVREQRQWMPFKAFAHNLQEVPIILRPEKQRSRERRSMNDVKIVVGGGLRGGSRHGVGLSH
jgi:hypothetical protein